MGDALPVHAGGGLMTTVEPEVLLPDVQTKVAELQPLSGQAQVAAVTALLDQSRFGLRVAIAAQDLRAITEWKVKGRAIQEIAKQLSLGKDMQLDAAEFVRRAERGLGLAVREGQQRGEIATKSSAARDRRRRERGDNISVLPSVKDVAPDFFDNSHKGAAIADFTDGVSDAVFEEALAEAREDANLSRAHVARKTRAKKDHSHVPPVPPQPVPRRIRKTAAARKVMEDLAITINSLVFVVNDTDPAEVEAAKHRADIEAIFQGMARIKKFLNAVKEQN